MLITIDTEFQALIPPLTADEYAQLEANILADGCRDPLVVWGGVLIDGHNRYEICTKHCLPFKTVEKEFSSKAEARIWMRTNQAGRRNLPDAWKIDLQLGNKADLAEIGRAKQSEAGGDKVSKQATAFIKNDKSAPAHNTQKEIAKAAGVSTGKVAQAEIVKRKAPDLWEKAKAEEITIGAAYTQVVRAEKEEKRESRRQENRAKISEVVEPFKAVEAGARFATIMIDPPWDWGDEGDKDQLGRARPDYGTMSLNQLMELPVESLADDDCHIYMWITNRSLPKGFQLLDRWGFRYVTAITWVKPHFGMGNYFRGQTEHILFGVRGSQPLKRKDASTVFMADRGKGGHSSKPIEFYDFIESCSPGPYLEMFSRNDKEGWSVWGEASHECA